jgi:hypothetical protein
MDDYYPVKILATGGMIGNALFFALSSFGLYLSWTINPKQTFSSWYGSRIMRIYPSVWIIVIFVIFPLSLLLGTFKVHELLAFVGKLFYPPFWFLQALMIYYLILYFILRNYSKLVLLTIAVFTTITYGTYYYHLDLSKYSIESTPFRIVFYFAIFLWGIYLASIKATLRYQGCIDYVLAFLCIGIMYLHKYMQLKGEYASLQFIQQLVTFPLIYYLFKIAKSPLVSDGIMNHRVVGNLFNYLSTITLELFMINNLIGDIVATMTVKFPFNVSILLSINFIFAAAVYYTAQPIRKALSN